MNAKHAPGTAPSFRLRGEGRGEGLAPKLRRWRGPLTRNLRKECANSDLAPQAGRGQTPAEKTWIHQAAICLALRRSMPTAMAGFALAACPTAARCCACRPASGRAM